MTVIARVYSMQVKDEALDELSFRAVEKFNAYMDDIKGDFTNRFRYGIASTADAALASLAREAELWIREWAERSEVKLSPEHIQVYAELNQTCSKYLFWPNDWDGDYELEFGNGKELS